MIPKIYLIDFFCSNAFRAIPRKSEWHISSLQNYRRWKYLDSLQSKWGKDELSISGGSSFFVLAISPLATQAKLCPKVSSYEFQSVKLTLWSIFWHFGMSICLHPLQVLCTRQGCFFIIAELSADSQICVFQKNRKNFLEGVNFWPFSLPTKWGAK